MLARRRVGPFPRSFLARRSTYIATDLNHHHDIVVVVIDCDAAWERATQVYFAVGWSHGGLAAWSHSQLEQQQRKST